MLKIKDLHFRYSANAAPVLKGASLELRQGEVGILLGKNGSGKTTLFKNILGIEKPKSGSIEFDEENLLKMNRRERARRIAYVPQDIHFGALTVFDSILMGRVSYFGLKASLDDYMAVEKIIADMGLSSFAHRNVDELSGGERQKIAIARAMAQEPKLMVFDEPTGNLDIANEQLIIEEAKRLARQKNIGILSSLHDLNQALYFGDKFFFLKDGVVKYAGGKEIVTEEVIKDIFDIAVKIVQINNQKVILGGYWNED
jgi:iron complex transport system ATP-binding protein